MMEMAAWIVFCFFASVGLVQCGFWVTEAFKRPKGFRHGYHLIPLYDDPEQLESQLRYALSQIRRDAHYYEQVILIDTGLGEECQKICEKLVWGFDGVYICGYDGLIDMISNLDNLQNGINDVE